MALKYGDRVVELNSASMPPKEGCVVEAINDHDHKKSWAVIAWDNELTSPGFFVEGKDFALIQKHVEEYLPSKAEAHSQMLLHDVPPQKDSVLTQHATAEQAVAFIESCIGENVTVEMKENGKGGHGGGGSQLMTIMVKLVSATVNKQQTDRSYQIYFHAEGRDPFIAYSIFPFTVKKCAPAASYTF